MKARLLAPFVVAVLSFVVYFAATEHLILTVGWPTGDEPYYLLIAHSLIHDHDFELTNNFANGDYLAFYPGDLYPRHEAVTPRPLLVSKHSLGLPVLIAPAYAAAGWRGAAHVLNLFGALLAVNIFLLVRETVRSERLAWLVWAALALAPPLFTYAELIFPEVPAALLIVYAYRHLRAWQSSNRVQQWLVVLCLAYLPWLHSRFLFVALGLGLYLLANLWAAHRDAILQAAGFPPAALRMPCDRPPAGRAGARSQGAARLRAASRQAGTALHIRLRSLSPAVALMVPVGISALLYLAYNMYVYDSLLPSYADHSGTGSPPEIFAAFFGIWLDQQWGLLNHAPVYLLALAALAAAALQLRSIRLEEGVTQEISRFPLQMTAASSSGELSMLTGRTMTDENARQLPLLSRVVCGTGEGWGGGLAFAIRRMPWKWPLLIIAPYFVLVVQYRYWWGEWCPPARYLTPVLPLLAAPLALALRRYRTFSFRLTFLLLSLLGWGVALAFAWDGRLMYNQPLGTSVLLAMLSRSVGLDLTALEPSFIMMFLKDIDPPIWIATQTVLTLGWLVALSLIAFWALGGRSLVLPKRLTLTGKLPIMRPRSPQQE